MEGWKATGLAFGNGYCCECCRYSLRNMMMIPTSSVSFQNRKPNFAVEFWNIAEFIILKIIETDFDSRYKVNIKLVLAYREYKAGSLN